MTSYVVESSKQFSQTGLVALFVSICFDLVGVEIHTFSGLHVPFPPTVLCRFWEYALHLNYLLHSPHSLKPHPTGVLIHCVDLPACREPGLGVGVLIGRVRIGPPGVIFMGAERKFKSQDVLQLRKGERDFQDVFRGALKRRFRRL